MICQKKAGKRLSIAIEHTFILHWYQKERLISKEWATEIQYSIISLNDYVAKSRQMIPTLHYVAIFQ